MEYSNVSISFQPETGSVSTPVLWSFYTTGGYWGAATTLHTFISSEGAKLHIQLNPATLLVSVVNKSPISATNVSGAFTISTAWSWVGESKSRLYWCHWQINFTFPFVPANEVLVSMMAMLRLEWTMTSIMLWWRCFPSRTKFPCISCLCSRWKRQVYLLQSITP